MRWRLFSVLRLLVVAPLASWSLAQEFPIGRYRAYALIGEPGLSAGTDYVSFAGDTGFFEWLPDTGLLERYVEEERALLSRFQLNVVNLEYGLPGFTGKELDRSIDRVMSDVLERLGYQVVGRANNHTLDYGPELIPYTSLLLQDAGLTVIGLRDSPVYFWTAAGLRIAIYALTAYSDKEDRERRVLTTKERDLAFVRERASAADFRIAFVHLGSMSSYPSSHERRQVERLIETGADMVVCSGSHFFRGFVVEGGIPVAYGIGNHLFFSVDATTEGIGVHFVAGFRSGRLVQAFVVPFWNEIRNGRIGPLDEPAFASFRKDFVARSTTDPREYYSDERTLEGLKHRLGSFRFSDLKSLRPRHLTYATLIVFHHYPVASTAAGVLLLGLTVVVLRRVFRARRSDHT